MQKSARRCAVLAMEVENFGGAKVFLAGGIRAGLF
jgi:hypothetical protein